MIKFDLHKTEDLALVGVLLARGVFPVQGCNYITQDGKREQFAYFEESAREKIQTVNLENLPEYRAAYLMAVFIQEARKQVPLVVHKLPNEKEVMLPADMKKSDVLNLMRQI